MEKPESIAQIKARLAEIEDASHAYIDSLRSDARQGVQKLLIQFDKKIEKAHQLVVKYEEMLLFENTAFEKGHRFIAGIDEVGRGPLAGPVVAAAVILAPDTRILGLNDSKQLSTKHREVLIKEIEEKAVAIGIGIVEPAEIDQINIYQASKKAMVLAVQNLSTTPDCLLIDAMNLPLEIAQEKIIKGDARSVSIAAASVVAKVYRDHLMQEYDQQFPGYGFAKNAGYGTKEHLIGLENQGITPIHRRSFSPVSNYLKS